MSKIVPLHEFHERNGHLTDFGGFSLPLWFKGITQETLAVRNAVGIFDVSHMGRAIVNGTDALTFLENLTTNDVASLQAGQGQYSLICNQEGGIKDDLLVFRLEENKYLLVYNAGNRTKDFNWMQENNFGQVTLTDISDSVAMFAVQGPNTVKLLSRISEHPIESIPRFGSIWTKLAGIHALISRTGYTGEDGFEVFVWDATIANPRKAQTVWNEVLATGSEYGIEPCGLGARDLLRLEAGLCLYGNDMDEHTNPFEARLTFVVKFHKDFIGKEPLLLVKQKGPATVRVGLITLTRVIPRHGFEIFDAEKKVGMVTSGSLSPTVARGIAIGYVDREAAPEGKIIEIKIRDRLEKAKLVKPPFYDTSKYGYTRKSSNNMPAQG